MRFFLLFIGTLLGFSACVDDPAYPQQKEAAMPTNKEKAIAVLRSIETGDAEAVRYIDAHTYIQHNLAVKDGIGGFAEVLQQLPKGSARVETVRAIEDGDYVAVQTRYDFFGPKAGFDIFRFKEGKIVEHWDNLQAIVTQTASGRSQFDGETEITDRDKTEANKMLVRDFVSDVLLGKAPEKIGKYIDAGRYLQHNPHVKDGLDGLFEALKSMADAGMPMRYAKTPMILGEGNFVLAVSEGVFMDKPSAFYDLFRIEGGRIVEHWDTIETIPPRSEWKNENGKF